MLLKIIKHQDLGLNTHNKFIPLLKYQFTTDAYGNTFTTIPIPSDKLNENYQKLKLVF